MALLLVSSCLHVLVSPEQIKKGVCIAKYSFIACHSGGARFFLIILRFEWIALAQNFLWKLLFCQSFVCYSMFLVVGLSFFKQ